MPVSLEALNPKAFCGTFCSTICGHQTKSVGDVFCLTQTLTISGESQRHLWYPIAVVTRGDFRAMVVTGRMMYGDSCGSRGGRHGW
jgi:hypothetical protein